jgi:carbon-monoxide dehydrogenase small subunit
MRLEPDERVTVAITVNGLERSAETTPRTLLSDFIRDRLGMKGTNVGCEHGYCGACTILVDGETVRSCLMLAVQADGTQITTVEGLADHGQLSPLQNAFREAHGLQCGFCTPGILMTATELLGTQDGPMNDDEIRRGIAGNVCRCTGYVHIVDAIRSASEMGLA